MNNNNNNNKHDNNADYFNMKELRSRYELNEFELKISLSRHVVLDNT